MSRVKQMFVNLPVKDLEKTKAFWTALGFAFDARFTDEKAGALVLGENIFAMLLREPFFKTFTDKEIIDASSKIEVINAISFGSREEVVEIARRAVEAGGKALREQDYGWMYSQQIEDLDGHLWEPVYMDMTKLPSSNT